jgi:large repetitive protein
VEVWDGSTLLCTATVQSDGSWSCTSTADLSEGAHALTIVARDAAGNISETGTLTITVVHERLLYLPVIGKGSALGVAAGIR